MSDFGLVRHRHWLNFGGGFGFGHPWLPDFAQRAIAHYWKSGHENPCMTSVGKQTRQHAANGKRRQHEHQLVQEEESTMPVDPTVICHVCGTPYDDEEDFEMRGDGEWCNLGGCVNNPICGTCTVEHYDWHDD